MKPAPFDYFAPTSVKETCALFARYGENAKIFWPEDKVCTSACPTPGATRSTDRQ